MKHLLASDILSIGLGVDEPFPNNPFSRRSNIEL